MSPDPPENVKRFGRWPKVSPNSMAARVLLAFLCTAGMLYVNIMPALVDGLKTGLGFSNKQAGLVGAFNIYAIKATKSPPQARGSPPGAQRSVLCS